MRSTTTSTKNQRVNTGRAVVASTSFWDNPNVEETPAKFNAHREFAKRAAKELCYGPDVVERVANATTNGEIQRIMIEARYERLGRD